MSNTSHTRPILSDRYELHRRIAKGGMADVFLARDRLLERPVAVKVLFPQYASEPSFVERFRREAQAAGKLNHPNIVAVYDWGEHEETYFIVMEYIEGRTLAQIISAEGHLDAVRAARIGKEVAAALSFAHRNGTVHRDVKPANIMITNEGQVKVADFGIARAFGLAEDELTQTGSVMGTASYFSPEQAQGKQVDPRSDLYALGVVLFEALCGRTPFSGDSSVAIAYKHVQEMPPRVTDINPAAPAPMSAIVAQLLQKDPRARYPAAHEVMLDLSNFMEGRALEGIRGAAVPPIVDRRSTATTVMPETPTAATTRVMQDTGSNRALIDTTRAVPVAVAADHGEPIEEQYYQPPARTNIFVVMLVLLGIGLAGLVFYIIQSGGSSTEAATTAIPDVIGETESAARNLLTGDGFEAEIHYEQSDEDPGTVFRMDPVEGTKLAPGATVKIWVSSEAETVQVPDVIGKSEDDARNEMGKLGLQTVTEAEASELDEGTVIRTEPEAGTAWDPDAGESITLFVSSGPSGAALPDVAGKSVVEAKQILGEAGFENITEAAPEASGTQVGHVARTEPAANTVVNFKDEITIFPSSGASVTTMPNLQNLTQAQAKESLNKVGITSIEWVRAPVVSQNQNGRVINYSPSFGSTVSVNNTVRVTLGEYKAPTTTSTNPPVGG